ncbi:hypothetical protein Tco_0552820 [Tanacetum coccineum]
MSTQQDIYAASSKNRPPMLNKDNYVPWSSRLLCYAKSKPNGKLLVNSIKNGPYVRRMIHEPGDPKSVPPVAKSTHEQTDDELTEKEVKQMEADDQSIQTILMGLPKDIYAAIDSFDYIQLYDFLKLNQAEVDAIRAERLTRTHDPLAIMANSQNPYNNPVFYPDQPYPLTYMQQPQPNNNYILRPSLNTNYMQQPMTNPNDISNPTTLMNMTLVLMAKAFKLNYSTPTNNNHRTSSNPHNRQIAQPGMNMGYERQIQIVRGNGEITNQNVNQTRNGNVVAAWAGGNGNWNNGDIDEIEEVNANCILMANLQQASTSGTQTNKAPIYDSNRSAETQLLIAQKEEAIIQLKAEEFDLMAAVGNIDEIKETDQLMYTVLNCYENEIFNMLTQEEQYTDLLEHITEPHQVQQNDNNVISKGSSVELSGE